MSSFRLILKNLTAIFTSNVISILTELVQPAIFLRGYGTMLYADWIVLSSAVSYLATLNFGLQTYINQDLAIRYSRGERTSFHVQQSTALRALLATTFVAAAACLIIFVLPIERILNLAPLSHWVASTALYFIALQILTGSMIYSYFGGAFMAVGLAHRGNNWNNAQRFGNAVVLCTLAALREPLYVLAIGQFVLYLVLLTGLLFDLKRKAPDIFPTLKYWDGPGLVQMMRPSLYFAIQFAGNFLAFELPLILLRRFAGAAPVVIFTLGRKIFSFGRQILTGLTQSLGPEITRMYGRSDWGSLFRLYDYSERVIFALIAMLNVPLFVFSPVLLRLWVHKPELFSLNAYALLSVAAIVICIKEHKMQFQNSTNTHERMGRWFVSTYLVMAGVSIPAILFFGVNGLIATWALTEMFQVWTVVRLNRDLFAVHEPVSTAFILKLAELCAVGLALGYAALWYGGILGWHLAQRIGAGAAIVALMVAGAWWMFRLGELTGYIRDRLPARLRFGKA